jgi:Fe-S-cluster containining protein
MGKDRRLDVSRAVSNFLRKFESLSRLPLITDTEMDRLFGEEVNLAIAELEFFNRKENFCRCCTSRCCQIVNCEIYSSKFSRCPIYDFRPLLCRMHFCHKFPPEYSDSIRDLGDIFLDSLVSIERRDNKKARLFDSPSFKNCAPELAAKITPLIKAFEAGSLDEVSVFQRVREII